MKKKESTVLLSENQQAVLMERVFPAVAKHAMDAYSRAGLSQLPLWSPEREATGSAQLASETNLTTLWVSCTATWGCGEKPTAAQNRILKFFPDGADLEPPTSPLLKLSAQKNVFPRTTGSSSPCRAAVAALLLVSHLLGKGRTAFSGSRTGSAPPAGCQPCTDRLARLPTHPEVAQPCFLGTRLSRGAF